MYLKRLKELREDHDLLQKQVAIALKITRQQYGLYENGDRTLPIDKLLILSKLYETSADYILGLTDEIKPYPKKIYKLLNIFWLRLHRNLTLSKFLTPYEF